ncbi:hypothetical protein H9P43_000359 [Blastocladiella emersonii ATCC 22665]|nr:hypothetical protein H9P43_000359 [Blastocladiella emersonii ATCC 22665]
MSASHESLRDALYGAASKSPTSCNVRAAYEDLIQQYYALVTRGCARRHDRDAVDHSPLCGMYLNRYQHGRDEINLPVTSRLSVVLATLGPRHLCPVPGSPRDDAAGPACRNPLHEHAWSGDDLPPSYRRGWDHFGDAEVAALVNGYLAQLRSPAPSPVAVSDGAPFDWDAFLSMKSLRALLIPAASTTSNDAIPGFDLEHLHRLALRWGDSRPSLVGAWTNTLGLFQLGLESLRAESVPVLLAFFFTWTAMPLTASSTALATEHPPAPSHLTATACDILHRAPPSLYPVIAKWLIHCGGVPHRAQGRAALERMLTLLHDAIADWITDLCEAVEPEAAFCIKTLKILDTVNRKYDLVPLSAFYHPEINDYLSVRDDYLRWKSPASGDLAMAKYPFLLTPATKAEVLRVESTVHMRHELQATFFRSMFVGVQSPYLDLTVSRGSALRDTLVQLAAVPSARDLRKQLRVRFVGEPGVDEGGVQRELLQLVTRDLFAPEYGMFVTHDAGAARGVVWFRWAPEYDAAALDEYELVGKLVGIALYNSIPLPVRFPLAVYKKLVGEPLALRDLAEVDPDLARGLETLAAFEGDVADAYCRAFTVDLEALGVARTFDLVPGGAQVELTNANRLEYIARAVDFYLNRAVESPFAAFRRGFDTVTGESSVRHLFRGEELMQVVAGTPDLDFDALEAQTVYDGYADDAPVVGHFWRVVRGMTPAEQRRLLFFATGSDRAPAGGLGRLHFVIMRQGSDADRLPSAHTCFNVLMLPEYASEAALAEKLRLAIANAEGFGLM